MSSKIGASTATCAHKFSEQRSENAARVRNLFCHFSFISLFFRYIGMHVRCNLTLHREFNRRKDD